MSIFNEFFKKEKPVFTGLKFGFGSGSSGPSITPATPFTAKIVLIGGGAGGGAAQGGGAGGAGGVAFFDFPVTIGTSYPLRVGSGGKGGDGGSGLDGEYSQWTSDPGNYLVGEGGAGGEGPSNSTGANGNFQGGSGGGGGIGGGAGSGSPVPSPRQPYIFGGFQGRQGNPESGGSGGNLGGGGGGATQAGQSPDGPGTPGSVGGGNGGAGKEIPTAWLPDSFTQTITGPQPTQFLGMLTSRPATERRTFGGGGGGGAEHGLATSGVGGVGGGGHGGYGSPPTPAAPYSGTVPSAGPTGQVYSNPASIHGEPGYRGRGGGGGGGGYTNPVSLGGGGGAGVFICRSPIDAKITAASIPTPNVNTYTSGGYRYHVILGNNGTTSATGTVLSGTVSFGPN